MAESRKRKLSTAAGTVSKQPHPITAPAEELKYDPHGYTMERRSTRKENRQKRAVASFEKWLRDYEIAARRAFKLGFVCGAHVANEAHDFATIEKNWLTHERMEKFEAERAAQRRQKRSAA